MKHLLLGIMMLAAGTASATAGYTASLKALDNALGERGVYLERKIRRIDSIKTELKHNMQTAERLAIYNRLYDEYLTLCFDSTMVYAEKAAKLAATTSDYGLNAGCQIRQAQALATSGHFSLAAELLAGVEAPRLAQGMREEYYKVCIWTNMAWEEYCGDETFAGQYRQKAILYIDSLIGVTPRNTHEYHYRMGERYLYRHDYARARSHYLRALHGLPQNTRLYAQSAYALSMAYKGLNDGENRRKWLVNAAIADQITPLKENLALQQLAYLIKEEDGDLERANRYLMYSLEDAIYYNNRLRMLEVAKKIPDIAVVYQQTVARSNHMLLTSLLFICLLSLGLIVAVALMVRQKRKVARAKDELAQLNGRLRELNMRLTDTNTSREHYVGLFMDLCAAYINKLNKFRSTVELKVKVRQYEDIMRVVNSNARPSEAETREMFFNFDTAFLRLYPDFISKFNALLQPGKEITPKNNELLNTDLRIFALIRMGITDSNKIASLMFYSPQTIFNHRTQVRNRAINRETFEKEVMNICALMPDYPSGE